MENGNGDGDDNKDEIEIIPAVPPSGNGGGDDDGKFNEYDNNGKYCGGGSFFD